MTSVNVTIFEGLSCDQHGLMRQAVNEATVEWYCTVYPCDSHARYVKGSGYRTDTYKIELGR